MGYQNSNFKIGLGLFGCVEKYTEQSTPFAVQRHPSWTEVYFTMEKTIFAEKTKNGEGKGGKYLEKEIFVEEKKTEKEKEKNVRRRKRFFEEEEIFCIFS